MPLTPTFARVRPIMSAMSASLLVGLAQAQTQEPPPAPILRPRSAESPPSSVTAPPAPRAPTGVVAPLEVTEPPPLVPQPPPYERGPCPTGYVFFSGGEFPMGASGLEPDDGPVRWVRVGPFCLSQTEVTVREYRACVEGGGCPRPRTDGGCSFGYPDREDHPMTCLTWTQARAYARVLGGDLPTAAQWEYAARGAQGRRYAWGDAPPDCDHANVLAARDPVTRQPPPLCPERTTPVCSHPSGATPEGVCDMTGNVREWVLDSYFPGWLTTLPEGAVDPVGPTQGEWRLHRGGAYGEQHRWLDAARRNWSNPEGVFPWMGVRVVLPVVQEQEVVSGACPWFGM